MRMDERRDFVADEQKKYNTEPFVRGAFPLARSIIYWQIPLIPWPCGADSNSPHGVSANFHCVKSMFLVIQKQLGSLLSNGEILDRYLS